MEALIVGAVCLGLGILMFWIALPRDGELVRFLRPKYAEMTYSLVVTTLIGLGLAGFLGGLGSLAGFG